MLRGMETPAWLQIASSPGMWAIGAVFAGSALLQSFLFYRLARRTGSKLSMSDSLMRRAVAASFIGSLGPALGVFVGLAVIVPALGGAYSFARESAAVGAVMYEMIAAKSGAEAAGVPLTREGMTVAALPTVFWIGALGSFGWVLVGGVFTRWLPQIRNRLAGGDAKRLQIITMAMMLGSFGRMFANDSLKPLVTKGTWSPLIASLSGGGAAAVWLLLSKRYNKPAMRDYFLFVALVVGMLAGELSRR